MVLRVRKKDSAYLYQCLEAYEGLTNFTTLEETEDPAFREVALHPSPEQMENLLYLIERLKEEIQVEWVKTR